MAFHDVRFPERIALGAEGGPAFSTTIIASSGGHEQRQANWAVGTAALERRHRPQAARTTSRR